MKTENIIQEKTFQFAIDIVNTYKYLRYEKKEFILSKQLLRSGTSVGANVEEAIGGQSEKDFYAKLTISYKEAHESVYWIKLLTATNYLTKEQSQKILNDAIEICKIIGKNSTDNKSKKQAIISNYKLQISN